MKLSYFHDHKWDNKRTLCFILPDYMAIRLLAVEYLFNKFSKSIIIPTGIAKCHPKDQYKKSTGRDIAFNNIVPIEYTIHHVLIEKDQVFINLDDISRNNRITIILRKELLKLKITDVYKIKDL